jgi:hypothetical protein
MRGRLSMAVGRSTFGAERWHVTLPTDFRSPSENGHSRFGHLTARFAPHRTLAWLGMKVGTGCWKRDAHVKRKAAHWENRSLRQFKERGNALRSSTAPSS